MNQHMDLDESIPRPLNHCWLVAPVHYRQSEVEDVKTHHLEAETAWREVRNLPGILEKYGSRHRETQVALTSIWTWVL